MAWFRFEFSHLTQEAARAVAAIPGVKLSDRTAIAHENGAWLVERAVKLYSIRFKVEVLTPDRAPLDSIDALVPNGLREWVPAFLTPYQRDGILSMAHRDGHLHWAAGCLAGDTEVVVNRGGNARRMTIRDLVYKFNGGTTKNPFSESATAWDTKLVTYTQSLNEKTGALVKNRIVAAVASGVKSVFLVTTASGESIRATGDHRFLTPKGWFKLSDLSAGDDLLVEAWPTKAQTRKAKLQYEQVDHMWNHPLAVRSDYSRADRPNGIRRSARVAAHRLVAEAKLNGLDLATFVGRIVLGETFGLQFLSRDQHVHHIDGDHRNNAPENLAVLTDEEHHALHAREGGWRHVAGKTVPSPIVSIEPMGEEETFDLSMEDPHNNFVANSIVVHNSGKTAGAICWALAHPGATVLVTRAGVRRSHAREIERLTTHRALVLESAEDAAKLEDTEALFVVVGWEGLATMVEPILNWRPTNVIFDEVHKAKSHKRWGATQQEDGKLKFDLHDNIAAAAYRLSRKVKRRLGTTATPIKDRVRDLWAQLDLVHPDAWGPFFKDDRASFTGRYCAARKGMYGGIDTSGESNMTELEQRVSIVRDLVPHSVTHRHLPPRRRLVSYVTLDEQNAATGFTQGFFKKAAKGGKNGLLEAKLMEAAAKKRKLLLEMVEEAVAAKQKVVIFTGRREDCDKLAEAVQKLGTPARVFSGHGGTPPSVRDQIQQDYMSQQGPCILVGTGDAWGEGVNLQDTDVAFIAMLPYTPGQVVQWEGRFCRHGQKRPVLIQYLVAEGTVDEHVAGILLNKLPAVESVSRDDSVTGFADQLSGADDEESIIASIMGKLGI